MSGDDGTEAQRKQSMAMNYDVVLSVFFLSTLFECVYGHHAVLRDTHEIVSCRIV